MVPITCRKCGRDVQWATSAAGGRYLQDLSAPYENGIQYARAPHFKTCDGGARRDAERATATQEAIVTLTATLVLRYLDVFLDPAVEDGTVTRAEAKAMRAAARAQFTVTATRLVTARTI
jgi:hypothetical protein